MVQYENCRKDVRVDGHTSRPRTSMTDMNAARTKKLVLENKSNTWEIASAVKTRKQKWLFAIGFKSKSRVSPAPEFINSRQKEKNILVCSGFILKINDTALQ